MVVFTCTS